MKNTPPLRARGRYVLRNPWVANPGKLYTNMAIRTFEDVYELGTDVYETYYVPMDWLTGPWWVELRSRLRLNAISNRTSLHWKRMTVRSFTFRIRSSNLTPTWVR